MIQVNFYHKTKLLEILELQEKLNELSWLKLMILWIIFS